MLRSIGTIVPEVPTGLQEDLQRELRRTALPEQVGGMVQVDVVPPGECRRRTLVIPAGVMFPWRQSTRQI